MTTAPAEVEAQKQAAAERALELVKPGMIVGLGTGSTARYFIEGLARKVRNGLRVQAVVTSLESRAQATAGGIPITERVDGSLDLAVDGADEIDPAVNCVKGRGGALLREKIVAHASRRFVLIADETKLVGRLGRGPVPVEVLPFLWEATSRSIESLGGRPELRTTPGGPFKTDNGNLVLDTTFGAVDAALGVAIHAIPGVIEHGLFFGMARAAIVGSARGLRILGELP
ncbi:MAG: ribose-5-phosphate isomerase RpiA [Candidatus Dormibacteraeota bacterium]|nr:ribose-5-phosphate isomerase RpiA [Candidatus Dormibacteraeota bacterium]